MREKMLKIADRLMKRADEYEAPFSGTKDDFYLSSAFPIVMVLREVATQIRAELNESVKFRKKDETSETDWEKIVNDGRKET